MIDDTHLCHQLLRHDGFAFVVLIIRGELQLVNGMAEVVSGALVPQVWNQFVYVLVVRRLEGTTGGEVDIAGDLVDTETTRDVATLMSLILQFFRPTFFHALVYPIKLQCSQRMHVGE